MKLLSIQHMGVECACCLVESICLTRTAPTLTVRIRSLMINIRRQTLTASSSQNLSPFYLRRPMGCLSRQELTEPSRRNLYSPHSIDVTQYGFTIAAAL